MAAAAAAAATAAAAAAAAAAEAGHATAAAAAAAEAGEGVEYGGYGVLTYEWHAKMYLGAARGVSGILFVLMQGERGPRPGGRGGHGYTDTHGLRRSGARAPPAMLVTPP